MQCLTSLLHKRRLLTFLYQTSRICSLKTMFTTATTSRRGRSSSLINGAFISVLYVHGPAATYVTANSSRLLSLFLLEPLSDLIVLERAILHDEKAYQDPLAYNPDRFLRPDGTLDPNVRDPSVAAFGFGRRICPGRFMAIDSMWITIACVLTVFEIKKAIGEDGKEVAPDGEYISGFLRYVVS